MFLINFFILGILTALLSLPFFIFPLGFLVFPCINLLLIKLRNFGSLNLFFLSGFFYGLGLFTVFLIWIINPFFIYDATKDYAYLSFVLFAILSILFGLGFIFFKYIEDYFKRIFFIPLIFVIIEMIISNIWYGFPWLVFANIISNNIFGLQLLKITGSHFVSFSLILIFLFPSIIFKFSDFKKLFQPTYFLFIILIIFCIIIQLIFLLTDKEKVKNISVDIYQMNIPTSSTETKNYEEIYESIFNFVSESDADLMILGENNFPYIVDDKTKLIEKFPLKENQTLIIGATTKDDQKYFNSFLVIKQNSINYFDKKILVPFGEFLPFRKYLSFMEIIAGSIDFNVGQNQRLIELNNNLKLIPIICYEIIFFWKILDKKNTKADLLINITNDGWFGKHIGPYQHFYLAKMRAAELNKTLIRVSNNGISGIFDNNGKILVASNLNTEQVIQHQLIYKNKNNLENLKKYYNYFIIVLFFVFLYLVMFKKNKNDRI